MVFSIRTVRKLLLLNLKNAADTVGSNSCWKGPSIKCVCHFWDIFDTPLPPVRKMTSLLQHKLIYCVRQTWSISEKWFNINFNILSRYLINTNININSFIGLLSISIPISILPKRPISISKSISILIILKKAKAAFTWKVRLDQIW